MFVVRHANVNDLDAVFALAEQSGIGMTTLPANKEVLLARLERIEKTLRGEAKKADQGYLFVLEDTVSKQVVGLSGIEVAIGLKDSFYTYHIGKQVHASQTLDTYNVMETLILGNDLTGSSELCTLFLNEGFRHSHNGKLLSKIRFLFIAAFPQHFEEKLIAEMRGYSDEQGRSPFWDAVGSRFFDTEFTTADYLTGIGKKAFIAELMPRFPIYVDLLSPEAQAVIGKTHPNTLPASKVLQSEGLKYQNYVDIFDAGPTLEAEVSNLRAVNESQHLVVAITDSPEAAEGNHKVATQPYLCANDDYLNYRGCLIDLPVQLGDAIKLTAQQADTLHVKAGQPIRVLPLNPAN